MVRHYSHHTQGRTQGRMVRHHIQGRTQGRAIVLKETCHRTQGDVFGARVGARGTLRASARGGGAETVDGETILGTTFEMPQPRRREK